ncbi:GNAT family N-acetyltransferase [Sphingomonas adhaesiva]|uniref:GNAT family N-acetyltransferase n=1 Tax=Sphingomonas adhaesiva TaxID=28212 RepID=UPI002FF7E8E7
MENRIVLRRAEPHEVAAIRDLTLRAYAKWVPITPRKPRPMTADYDAAIRDHRFDGLYDDGVLVALIETVVEGSDLMIVNVAVDPAHQGRGLGVRLMRFAEGLAREAGCRATRLYTNRLMRENIALYERLGYAFERETHHDMGTVAVHMVRLL